MSKNLNLILAFMLAINSNAQSTKNVTLTYSFSEFQTHTTDEGIFITSDVYGVYYPGETDEPALPFININVLISPSESLGDYTFSKNEMFVLSNVDITPNHNYLPNNLTSPQSPSPEPKSYPASEYPVNQVEYLGSYQMNGYQMLTFSLCPFRYNTNDRTLYLMNTCSLQLSLIPDTSNTQNLSELRRKRMAKRVKEIVINGEDLDSLYSEEDSIVNNIKYEYLLITCDSLKNAFQPLADWKTQKGVRSKILTVSEINNLYSARNAPLRIKKAIEDYYKYHGTSYVLIGGDVDIVPAQLCRISLGKQVSPDPNPEPAYVDSVCTDLFYSCLGTMDWDTNGDGIYGDINDSINLLPDLAVTRFPIGTYSEAQIVANRVINYEQCLDISKYKKNILMCGKTRIIGDWDEARSLGQTVYDEHINPYWDGNLFRLYYNFSDSPLGSGYTLNNTNFRTELTKGYAFVNVDSHGYTYYWVWSDSPSDFYDSYYAMSFQNPCYSMIVTSACLTNAYDLQNMCLSERFIRNPTSNIFAYLGCSRDGWGGKKNEMGPSISYDAIFYDSLFSDFHKHFGDIVMKTRTGYAATFEMKGKRPYRWVLVGVNPVGDPEMPIFTDIPLALSDVTFMKDGNKLIIDAGIDDCKICVMSVEDNGNNLYEVKDSIRSLTLNFPNQKSRVCITRPGYKPYIAYIMNQQYIQNETLTDNCIFVSGETYIGKDVTPLLNEGPVAIDNGKTAIVNRHGVTIKNSFEVKRGAVFEIK